MAYLDADGNPIARSAPSEKPKAKKSAPARKGISAAFPSEFYMQSPGAPVANYSPWQAVANMQQEPQNYLPEMPAQPVQFSNTGSAQNILEEPRSVGVSSTEDMMAPLRPQLAPAYLRDMPRGTHVGDKNDAEMSMKQGQQRGRDREAYASPEDYLNRAAMVESLPTNQAVKKEMEDRRAYEKRLMALLGSPQLDVSPILALIDSETGSKLSASYNKPMTPEQKMAQLLGIKREYGKDLSGYADMIQKATPDMIEGKDTNSYAATLDESYKKSNENPQPKMGGMYGNPSVNANRFLTGFRSMPTYKDAEESLMSTKNVMEMVKNPSWLTDASAKANVLTAMKLHPISDRDAASVQGAQDVASRVGRAIQKLTSGDQLLPEDRAAIKKYAEVKQKAAKIEMDKARKEYVMGMAPHYGYDAGTADAIIAPTIPEIKTDTGPSQAQRLTDLLREALK